MPSRSSTASYGASCRRRGSPSRAGRYRNISWPVIRELVEFPYRLIYRVQPDAVEVLAILYVRQELSRGRPSE